MSADYYFIYVRDWLEFAIGMLSLLCSLMTLLIIYKMKTWNGNLLLITSLTIFQVCYDINFMLGICPGFAACVIWHILDVFGGLAVAFTTNVISFTVLYVVHFIESVNILKNYYFFAIFMILIPAIFGIMTIFTLETANADDDKPFTECVYTSSDAALVVENFYYWSRLASIGLNLVVFGYVWYRVRELGFIIKQSAAMMATVDDTLGTFERKSMAVKALARRMIYYPVAQFITRAGSAWNEYNNYEYSTNTSTLMSAICGSFSGTALFIVFLAMQPKAWEIFMSIITCKEYEADPNQDPNQLNLAPNFTTSSEGPSNYDFSKMFKHSLHEFDDTLLEEIVNRPDGINPRLSQMSGSSKKLTIINPLTRTSFKGNNYEDDIMKSMS